MCRFIMIKSQYPVSPRSFLSKFSNACKENKAYDGDWQGDGWGISCLIENHKPKWITEKSLAPIWEDRDRFSGFIPCRHFIVHARSASFPKHKNNIDFNQPFINGKYGFVFNGLVNGVTLPMPVEGSIGSQKIWSLLQKMLSDHHPESALCNLKQLLEKYSRGIQALNIGLFSHSNMYVYSHFMQHPEYYRLHFHDSPTLKIVASDVLDGFTFVPVEQDSVLVF